VTPGELVNMKLALKNLGDQDWPDTVHLIIDSPDEWVFDNGETALLVSKSGIKPTAFARPVVNFKTTSFESGEATVVFRLVEYPNGPVF
jgi:hypothetical protein